MDDAKLRNLERLESIVKLLNDSISKDEFVKSFKNVVEKVKLIEERTALEVEQISNTLSELGKKVEADTSQNFDTLKADVLQYVADKLSNLKDGIDGVNGIDGKNGENGKDGISPDPVVVIQEVVKELHTQTVRETLLDTPEDIRNKLELLQGDERLKAAAIIGLEELLVELQDGLKVGAQTGWGAHPLTIAQSGTTKAKTTRHINFKGTAVSSVVRNADGTVDVTLNGGGAAGATFETPTGTVDGANTTFTATQTPIFVIVDGVTYFENNGYTLSGVTITTSVPPSGFIRSAY